VRTSTPPAWPGGGLCERRRTPDRGWVPADSAHTRQRL
jgi:hypothetical protein